MQILLVLSDVEETTSIIFRTKDMIASMYAIA